jgi:acyl dehydratase
MEISSRFVGTPLRSYKTAVTPRETMNYAAAIKDTTPCYFDDEGPKGIVAHPMNAVALTWKITGKIWEFIESEDFPLEILLTQVHYSETLEFHRLLIPGETLIIKGEIAAILPHRAGTRVVIKYDAIDEKGLPVFTEYLGALMRGVTCPDGGSGESSLPRIPLPKTAGKTIWEAPVDIDPMQPFIYDGCTDIVFPIHTSKKFAASVGLPGIILQGTATLALAVREIIDREADGHPSRLKCICCRFTGMVLPSTRIGVQLTGTEERNNGRDLFFQVINPDGHRVISDGYALITDQ